MQFDRFARMHPWVGEQDVSPKSIGREMVESFASFDDYVRLYQLQRSEGVLLRYLSQLYRTLDANVPDGAKTEPVDDAIAFLRTTIELSSVPTATNATVAIAMTIISAGSWRQIGRS